MLEGIQKLIICIFHVSKYLWSLWDERYQPCECNVYPTKLKLLFWLKFIQQIQGLFNQSQNNQIATHINEQNSKILSNISSPIIGTVPFENLSGFRMCCRCIPYSSFLVPCSSTHSNYWILLIWIETLFLDFRMFHRCLPFRRAPNVATFGGSVGGGCYTSELDLWREKNNKLL